MKGHASKSIGTAARVSIGVIAVFLLVAVAGQAQSPLGGSILSRTMWALLPQLGNLVIAVATVWYVVFTYHMLVAADATRSFEQEPRIRLVWLECREPTQVVAKGFEGLSELFRTELYEPLRISVSPGESERRYIVVRVENVRKAPVGAMRLLLRAESRGGPLAKELLHPVEMTWEVGDIRLESGKDTSVTCLDLGAVPEQVTVNVRILEITYKALDGGGSITDFLGNSQYACSGVLGLNPAPAPVPVEETSAVK